MTIKSLTIENLRGFAGKHVVEFTDRKVAAFIGVNGSGKSTVLEAVAHSLSTIISAESGLHFNPNDVNVKGDTAGWLLTGTSPRIPSTHWHLGASLYNESGVHSGPVMSHSNVEQELINLLAFPVLHDQPIPVVSFYHQTSNIVSDTEKKLDYTIVYNRQDTYKDSSKSWVDYNAIRDFYTQAVNVRNNRIINSGEKNYISPVVEAFNQGLKQFLGVLTDSGQSLDILLTNRGFRQTIVYKKAGQEFELNQLSSGEKAIVALVLDLIFRCVIANGEVLDNPLSSPGIVLIDEIELHLHPRWQANIIKALTTTFPNIQFLISTHAPLVINRLKSEQVFVLKNNEIVPAKRIMETYGMDMNAVISQLMHAPIRPKEVEDEFWKIKKLLDEPTPENLARVKQLLNELRELIDPNDLELTLLSNILSIEESAVDI